MSTRDFLVEIGTEELPPKALPDLEAAFREGLELEDNPRVAKRYQELVDANAFQIKGVEVESDSATPKICLKFS